MGKRGTRYDQEFKRMIVDLYNTGEHTYASLESEYGIVSATIQRWGKQYSPINPKSEESISPDDLRRLQMEMTKLREENEILKKTMAILAKK